jgi:hypothetical protein
MSNPAEPDPVAPVSVSFAFRPMTNTERQRRFRERNPGYYGRLHCKRNAAIKASLAAKAEAKALATAAAIKPMLALPAPDPEAHRLLDDLKALQAKRERAAIMIER